MYSDHILYFKQITCHGPRYDTFCSLNNVGNQLQQFERDFTKYLLLSKEMSSIAVNREQSLVSVHSHTFKVTFRCSIQFYYSQAFTCLLSMELKFIMHLDRKKYTHSSMVCWTAASYWLYGVAGQFVMWRGLELVPHILLNFIFLYLLFVFILLCCVSHYLKLVEKSSNNCGRYSYQV